MNLERADKIAKAVLYEGYLLYPYTPSSTKNQDRWNFGGLYPESYVIHQFGSDAFQMKTEFLVEGDGETEISLWVRFLHLITRKQRQIQWEEGQERELPLLGYCLKKLAVNPQTIYFDFPQREWVEVADAVEITRIQRAIQGRVEITAQKMENGSPQLWKLQILLCNSNPVDVKTRKEALPYSLASTHALISVQGGQFVSMIDPHEIYRGHASHCENKGLWPVLVGNEGERDLVLSAPIILYDYPEIAPESPGDLFDGGEIDEILSLRIMTLTDQEKEEIRCGDERGREMLERTENLSQEELLNLHGTFRDVKDADKKPGSVRVGEVELKPGDQVRLCPKGTSDIMDITLKGMVATITSIEQDFEDQVFIGVTINDDPGSDLGREGKPGHRFFFKPDEVEVL